MTHLLDFTSALSPSPGEGSAGRTGRCYQSSWACTWQVLGKGKG